MDYGIDFSNNSQKRKKKIIFIVIFLIFVIMFVAFFFRNSNNEIVSKVASVISKPINFVYNGINNIFNSDSSDVEELQAQNEELKKENEELKMQVLESQKILDENTTLKEMLNIQKEYQHYETVMANIIYREHDNWTQTFTINVGSNETDQITKLNSTDLPELIESFVNAGLVKIQGSIEITKVDKNDNTKVIEGARFKLEKLDQNGNVDSTYTPQELTTGEDGKIKFDGLEVGKYRVTETKAPEGYELLKSSKDVEITGDNKDIKLIAENELKLHLPKTGSINCTAVFTTIGLTLVCIAIVLVIKNKKKIILRKK